jgi:hypothetical protein
MYGEIRRWPCTNQHPFEWTESEKKGTSPHPRGAYFGHQRLLRLKDVLDPRDARANRDASPLSLLRVRRRPSRVGQCLGRRSHRKLNAAREHPGALFPTPG